VGGGYNNSGDVFVYESEPDSTGQISPVGITPDGNGWTVAANTSLPAPEAIGFATAFAICTNAS
jgi:hypothetical protein